MRLRGERGILEETDYVNEARNIERFGKALAPLGFVQVPQVHHDLSSDQVLTMSRVLGLRLQDFLKTNPSQELRDNLGTGLTRLFSFSCFEFKPSMPIHTQGIIYLIMMGRLDWSIPGG